MLFPTVKIDRIVPRSLVDGPGARTVVFFQGCSIHCRGCQNRRIWDPNAGETWDVYALAEKIAGHAQENGGKVTISGGEPFDQPQALASLMAILKNRFGISEIIVYTGYTWERFFDTDFPGALYAFSTLRFIDVMVDGPFIQELDDDFLTYRGSRNQRPIDVQASLKAQALDPIVLDWSEPEIVLDLDGSAFMPLGVDIALGGKALPAPMCGQRIRK